MSRGGLAAIVRALGGDLYADGGRANVPGPGHSPADRSVSLMLSDGRVIAHSFAGDGWRPVLEDLIDRGLIDRDGRLIGAGVVSAASGPSARVRRAIVQGLWAEGRPITGTLSETYLRRRGISPELRRSFTVIGVRANALPIFPRGRRTIWSSALA